MPATKRRWTVADLADLPDDGKRYEVIDGDLWVTPAPSWNHQCAIAESYVLLAEYLGRERIGEAIFFAPADVTFSPVRGVRRTLYREEGVPEYWLVDLDSMTIERSTPFDARADILADFIEWRPDGAVESLRIDLPTYFANVVSG